MEIKRFIVNPLAVNCYLAYAGQEGILIDPGQASQEILNFILSQQIQIVAVINTHGHADHIGANEEIKNATGAKLLIHNDDADFLINPEMNLSVYSAQVISGPAADQFLDDGDEIKVGSTILLKVLHTPGHTPGCICLQGENFILTGDTLFAGSIGRTDFPKGSYEQIIKSIKEKLLPLPNHLLVYPGHGPSSNLQREKESNSFLS